MPENVLYMVVLPLIHISSGLTEQVITLVPDREFATSFFEDETAGYIAMFERRANQYLTGGHVVGYRVNRLDTPDGRFIVQVIQDVA